MSLPIPPGSKFDPNTGAPIPKFDPQTGKQNWFDDSPAALGIAVPACVPPAVTVQQPVVQQPGQTIIVQQGGGRAHKYDASVLSGAWMMENEACPGCCPRQVNIMAMGQDAFQLGQSPMFTRDGGTDNFRSAGSPGRGPCMALVLSENDIKLAAAGGNENFKLTKIKRTNLVDRAQTVQVQIPAGMMPGSVFDVQANGQRIRVTVPAGGKAGQLLNVRVPQQRPIGR